MRFLLACLLLLNVNATSNLKIPEQPAHEPSLHHRKLISLDETVALGAASTPVSLEIIDSITSIATEDDTTYGIQITPQFTSEKTIACTIQATRRDPGDDNDVVLEMYDGSFPIYHNDTFAFYFDFEFEINTPITARATIPAGTNLFVGFYASAFSGSQVGGIDGATVTCVDESPTSAPTQAPSAASTTAKGSSCFSEISTVQVQGKGTTAMKYLQVNDMVYTGNKGSQLQYQAVYAFGHHDTSTSTEYLKIHFNDSSNDPLEISATHLLFVHGKEHPVRAGTIQAGDLLVKRTTEAPPTSLTVTKVEKINRQGAYMPLTKGGSIVVNGVHASTYVSIFESAPAVINKFQSFLSEHDLLHLWLAPYRMVCMGISPKLCENDYNDEGISYWLSMGKYVAQVGDGWWLGFQLVGIAVSTLFMAASAVIELLFSYWFFLLGVLLLKMYGDGMKAKTEKVE